jgi:PKD domain
MRFLPEFFVSSCCKMAASAHQRISASAHQRTNAFLVSILLLLLCPISSIYSQQTCVINYMQVPGECAFNFTVNLNFYHEDADYQWYFGDGTSTSIGMFDQQIIGVPNTSGTYYAPSHVYTTPGPHTVFLFVNNEVVCNIMVGCEQTCQVQADLLTNCFFQFGALGFNALTHPGYTYSWVFISEQSVPLYG